MVSGSRARRQRPESPPGQHQHPQQQRAFVAAPDAGDAVFDGQQRIGVLGHVDHREVVGDESLRQAGEGEGDEQRQRGGSRAGDGDPGQAGVGADQRQVPRISATSSEDEGEMAEFGNHGQLPAFAASAEDGERACGLCRPASPMALAASGGM
jgi:hypothetical protein